MAFKYAPWETRFKQLGDKAEAAFERNYKGPWVRTGWNRPPINLANLSLKVQCIPDYCTDEGWVEVMGCGRDQIIKMKQTKLWALREWAKDDEVWIWVWDSYNKRYARCHVDEMAHWCEQVGPQHFPEGKVYFPIGAERFHWTPDGT